MVILFTVITANSGIPRYPDALSPENDTYAASHQTVYFKSSPMNTSALLKLEVGDLAVNELIPTDFNT